MSRRIQGVVVAVLLVTGPGSVRAESKEDTWAAFRFLLGEWVGEGDGKPGKGSGSFTLAPDLGGKVLVRRNRAETPKGVHEDLMVIHPAKDGRSAQATYWDNEGHFIRYAVTVSESGKGLTFLSDAEPGQPRFRLSYSKDGGELVTIRFEIAPPGKSDAFRTYLEGKARRKPGASSDKSEGK